MSIPVKYALKIFDLTEDDVDRVKAALDAWLAANGWHPDVQHIKTHWDDLSWIWYASDWDRPMLVARAVPACEELDRALREQAAGAVGSSKPRFETQLILPDA